MWLFSHFKLLSYDQSIKSMCLLIMSSTQKPQFPFISASILLTAETWSSKEVLDQCLFVSLLKTACFNTKINKITSDKTVILVR